MHGIELTRSGLPGASPLSSPTAVFSSSRINTSKRAAAFSRTEPVARNGLSLACNNDCSRTRHSRVNAPDLLLRDRRPPVPLPVRPFSSAACAGSPRLRPLHRLWPVAAFPANFRDCYPSFHSPSGLLHPSGSKRSAGSPPFGPPSGLARFPLTPRNRYLSLVMTTDQRLRFATFPEACCSSNLLEPSSLCAQDSFSSTRLCR